MPRNKIDLRYKLLTDDEIVITRGSLSQSENRVLWQCSVCLYAEFPSQNVTRTRTSRTCSGTTCLSPRTGPGTAAAPGPNTRPRPRTFSSHRPAATRPGTRRTPSPPCLCTGANTRPTRPGTRPRRRKCARPRTAWYRADRRTNTCNRPKCWRKIPGTGRVRCATGTRRYL